jgi:hypothetical protein
MVVISLKKSKHTLIEAKPLQKDKSGNGVQEYSKDCIVCTKWESYIGTSNQQIYSLPLMMCPKLVTLMSHENSLKV